MRSILLVLIFFFSDPLVAQVKILPLGNSITHGVQGYTSYRRELWKMLQNNGYSVDFVGSHNTFAWPVDPSLHDFDLDHEGHSGWRTDELNASLNNWLFGYDVDVALIHAGTNDVIQGTGISISLTAMNGIFNKLRQDNPDVTILLAKIIPSSALDVTFFNSQLVAWAADKSTATSEVIIVDHYAGYNAFSDNFDAYHPNTSGELKMATRWFSALEGVLVNNSNLAPTVDAGGNLQLASFLDQAVVSGTANDDGLPENSTLTTSWTKLSGPGTVVFGDASQLTTTVNFSDYGHYVLRLTASDGVLSTTDDVTVDVGSFSSAVLAGVAGRWRFAEGSGAQAADSSGNANNATLLGGASWEEGVFDNAMCLDGSSGQHAEIATASNELKPDSFTLSAWVKVEPGQGSQWGWIAAQGDNYGMVVNRFSDDSLLLYYHNTSAWPHLNEPGAAPKDSHWNHYASSFDVASNTMKLYKNGVLIKTGSGSGAISYTIGNGFTLGSMQGQRGLVGCLDEVQIYPRALTDLEVETLATPVLSAEDTDGDGDGFDDDNDNCPMHANSNQLDNDADGSGDLCDLDDDNDSLPDTYENTTPGFDPFDASDASDDFDADGYSNLEEYQAATDPNDENSFPISTPAFTLPNNSWKLISIPASRSAGNTVADVFGGALNANDYGVDWTVFLFSPASGYSSPALTDPLLPGKGYWVIQTTGASVDIDLGVSSRWPINQSAACVSATGCFEIDLASSDTTFWNLVGNPAQHTVAVDDLRILTANGACDTGCTLTQAESNNTVHDQMWSYSNVYQLKESGNSLNVWDGIWLPILSGADGGSPKLLVPANTL